MRKEKTEQELLKKKKMEFVCIANELGTIAKHQKSLRKKE